MTECRVKLRLLHYGPAFLIGPRIAALARYFYTGEFDFDPLRQVISPHSHDWFQVPHYPRRG